MSYALGVVLIVWLVASFGIADFYDFFYYSFGITPNMLRFGFAALLMGWFAWSGRHDLLQTLFCAALGGIGFNLLAYGPLGFLAGIFLLDGFSYRLLFASDYQYAINQLAYCIGDLSVTQEAEGLSSQELLDNMDEDERINKFF